MNPLDVFMQAGQAAPACRSHGTSDDLSYFAVLFVNSFLSSGPVFGHFSTKSFHPSSEGDQPSFLPGQ
jgi:hypothetical protein